MTLSGVFVGVSEERILYVCDAGPVIHLDELGYAWLLDTLPEVVIPRYVIDEVHRHRPAVLDNVIQNLRICESIPHIPPSLMLMARQMSLDIGETHAISLCHAEKGSVLLTDDLAARILAHQMSIPVHGTLGILLRSVRTRHSRKSEILDALRNLNVRSTLYVRMNLLNLVIEELEDYSP